MEMVYSVPFQIQRNSIYYQLFRNFLNTFQMYHKTAPRTHSLCFKKHISNWLGIEIWVNLCSMKTTKSVFSLSDITRTKKWWVRFYEYKSLCIETFPPFIKYRRLCVSNMGPIYCLKLKRYKFHWNKRDTTNLNVLHKCKGQHTRDSFI